MRQTGKIGLTFIRSESVILLRWLHTTAHLLLRAYKIRFQTLVTCQAYGQTDTQG